LDCEIVGNDIAFPEENRTHGEFPLSGSVGFGREVAGRLRKGTGVTGRRPETLAGLPRVTTYAGLIIHVESRKSKGEVQMFRAVGRFFRAIGYLLTGRVDQARRAISANPEVVQATFDKIIEEKKKRISQYKDAVGAMIAQEERKKSSLKNITEEIDKLRKLRDGAAVMARKVVDRHQGNAEAVKNDPEYLKCQAAYKDFSTTLAEKESHAQELESDIHTFETNIGGHKTQLQSLLREIDKLKTEKHETVAQILTSKEEKEIADMLSGISRDKTSEELQELRDVREQAKATARISREMAGVDNDRSEAEFLEYATKSAADTEFDALIGLAKESEPSAGGEGPERTKIPEA
jgi:phage shock protein A